MRIRIYILYISLFLFPACTVQYVIEGQDKKIVPVKSVPDKDIISVINPYKIGIDSVMNEILCFSSVEMSKGKPESLIGNFVTDICLDMYDTIADMCVMNNGGLRSSLSFGNVSLGDIYKLMPFENELVVLELNRHEIYQLAQYITSRGGEPFSGCDIYSSKDSLSINFHRCREMCEEGCKGRYGHHIHTFNLDDSSGQLVFRVLTSDYLANGGDKMSFFNNKGQYKVGVKLRDAIINYCISKDTINSRLDDRIKIIE